ncbi:hypothetical protein V6N13_023253 [Hibiscus sabdariffa]|uniref:Uncharacterized protein n=2 Tax=Hibiscus sabdariffa TaxID=183260 RepID=A0ABR2PLN5_9ROSI
MLFVAKSPGFHSLHSVPSGSRSKVSMSNNETCSTPSNWQNSCTVARQKDEKNSRPMKRPNQERFEALMKKKEVAAVVSGDLIGI